MKISESWLREWVDLQLDSDALVEQLTMAGLEVESVTPAAGAFSGVVVGEVVAVAPHSNADALSVCEVAAGGDSVQVVCGAPNVRAGMKSAFAQVGAVLPEGFKIKKAKLRGVVSHGMLCSASELGLSDDHSGILDLPSDLQPGQDLRSALALDDVIIDLDLTPNRGDCLSLKGVAREVGVLNNLPVTMPECPPVVADIDDEFPVTLSAPDGCPRYLGRVIRGIDPAAPTPHWMVERLRRCGIRSIDAVVDVTNYVLVELGQPMHAFDLDRLAGRIDVRRAQRGERLRLLDGKDIDLDEETLLIADDSGPIAIAGVMGGAATGVGAGTQNLFLECAYFSPLAVAGTARRYGLQTDAAHRYERGVDHGLQPDAMARATALLLEIAGGRAGPVVTAESADDMPGVNRVSLRQRRLNELVGVAVDPADVDETFDRLGFAPVDSDRTDADGVCWTITVPSHRFDIAIEADLIEEVCRIYGYNRVAARRPNTDLALRRVDLTSESERAVKKLLVDCGYSEVVTYSFVEPALMDLLDPQGDALTLTNPMSSEQSAMRTNLLPGLVRTCLDNLNRQQDRVRIFEVGQCFVTGDGGLRQDVMLGGLLYGSRLPESWADAPAQVDFFDLKGDLERVLGLGGRAGFEFRVARDPVLHPGQSADVILDGEPVGRLGRLHPEIERRLELDGVYVFEVRAEVVLARRHPVYRPVSKFPSVRRDLALVVDRAVPASAIERCVRGALGDVLTEFRLFDLYQGKGIDSNEKSVGVGLTFQLPSATLTDAEIGRYTDQVLAALATDLNARLR